MKTARWIAPLAFCLAIVFPVPLSAQDRNSALGAIHDRLFGAPVAIILQTGI